MKRLGYSRYVAQGAAFVVDLMGVEPPPGLLAIHSNYPPAVERRVTRRRSRR
jgi:hypothetical protein